MRESDVHSAALVLLVEDSVDDVLLTRRAFRKAGIEHVLDVCNDGETAVEYLQSLLAKSEAQALPVLVLLDWKLPKKNGLELLVWIRSQAKLRDLPVVVLSASGQQDEMDRAQLEGANAYRMKPLNLESLLSLLATLNLSGLQALIASAPK
jgi:CheY-like chemotaxis protein